MCEDANSDRVILVADLGESGRNLAAGERPESRPPARPGAEVGRRVRAVFEPDSGRVRTDVGPGGRGSEGFPPGRREGASGGRDGARKGEPRRSGATYQVPKTAAVAAAMDVQTVSTSTSLTWAI
ncbi:hypothetical protein GCM10023317_86150 [Actinopolymorpha pittospori]